MDTSTIDFYNQNAASYAAETLHADMHASRQRFLAHLPAGASVLATALEAAGFAVKELYVTADVRAGRSDERWINAIAAK